MMPLFKFRKSTKSKPPLKASSMGNLYRDYSGSTGEVDNAVSTESVTAVNTERIVKDLEHEVANLKDELEAIKRERNFFLLKSETLIDMMAEKTAENDKLLEDNQRLRTSLVNATATEKEAPSQQPLAPSRRQQQPPPKPKR